MPAAGLPFQVRTPGLNLRANLIPDLPNGRHFFVVSSGQRRGIGKAPVQTFRDAGENRTALGAGFVANRDDVGKEFPGFRNIENGPRFLFGNIDSDFLHRFHHQWIERARLETRALRFEQVGAKMIEPGFRHLASGAVVDADEKDLRSHADTILPERFVFHDHDDDVIRMRQRRRNRNGRE